jgi:hypothetical protein
VKFCYADPEGDFVGAILTNRPINQDQFNSSALADKGDKRGVFHDPKMNWLGQKDDNEKFDFSNIMFLS